MPIKYKSDFDAMFAKLENDLSILDDIVVEALQYVGREAVDYARSIHKGTFMDRTGNLRSSIGYVIVRDGEIVDISGFEPERGPEGDGEEGAEAGDAYARELASKVPAMLGQTVLIVAAGMSYASYVADRGLDVTAGAKLRAEDILPQLLANQVESWESEQGLK